ncbi:MAG: hypothetical protein ABIY71_04710 [Flavobacteriales bacterium]
MRQTTQLIFFGSNGMLHLPEKRAISGPHFVASWITLADIRGNKRASGVKKTKRFR